MPQAADDFLRTILRSGLLEQSQLEAAVRALPREGRADPDALAEYLIKLGRLSRFQANKLLAGTSSGLVLGSYQILAPLGQGGMGKVFLARDHRNGELLAVKVLSPRRAREEERMRARFQREMELSQRVAHPHLALTYEAGVCQGVYYLAMEFIPGKSLYRLVSDEGPLPVPRAAALFAEAAAALQHAHEQGLVHRDLKPSNIMVTPNDHAKVLDLGLALIEGETVKDRFVVGGQGYVVGSMDYIAPEQTEDAARVDNRADIYGLGCTLYFALTGRPPFPGGSSIEKIIKHRTRQPEPLARLNPNVPAPFASLVARMMAKRPEERPPSAAAVREALLAWASQQAVLPLDRPEDPAYQHAIAALASGEINNDALANGPILPGGRDVLSGVSQRLALGLAGLWLLLLLTIGLIVLLS